MVTPRQRMLDAIHYCLKAVDKGGGTSDGETAK